MALFLGRRAVMQPRQRRLEGETREAGTRTLQWVLHKWERIFSLDYEESSTRDKHGDQVDS